MIDEPHPVFIWLYDFNIITVPKHIFPQWCKAGKPIQQTSKNCCEAAAGGNEKEIAIN